MIQNGGKQEPTLLDILLKIICNKTNLIICLCLTLPEIGYYFFYYLMQGTMERNGLNFGLNMLFVGTTEFLAYLSACFFTENINRKVGLISSIVFVSTVGLLFNF